MPSFRERIKNTLLKCHIWGITQKTYYVLCVLKQANIIKSFYYSCDIVGLRNSFKLPVVVCKRVKFRKRGNISVTAPITPFMLKIGYNDIPAIDDNGLRTVFYNSGEISFGGPAIVHPGAKLWVEEGARLCFKGHNVIGANSLIACQKYIEFGNYSGFSWDCQVFDTDFHYMKDIVGNTIFNKVQEIIIGEDVFIGNHVNIGKGTKLARGTVVSSWSNLSGSYLKKGENALIAGNKATVVDTGYYIAHGYKMYIDDQFAREFNIAQNSEN